MLAITGVASAEIATDGAAISGVRVRLEPGSAPGPVGKEIQDVLARHGVEGTVGTRQDRSGPPPPPGAAGAAVVALASYADPAPDEDPQVEPAPRPNLVVEAQLDGVSVEESAGGTTITVRSTDGRTAMRRPGSGDAAMVEAVAAAVSELHGGSARFVGHASIEVGGVPVVVIVMEDRDGRRLVGASPAGTGTPYSAAKAAWAALASRP